MESYHSADEHMVTSNTWQISILHSLDTIKCTGHTWKVIVSFDKQEIFSYTVDKLLNAKLQMY